MLQYIKADRLKNPKKTNPEYQRAVREVTEKLHEAIIENQAAYVADEQFSEDESGIESIEEGLQKNLKS